MFVIGCTIQKLHTLVRISIGIVVYTISFFSITPTFALRCIPQVPLEVLQLLEMSPWPSYCFAIKHPRHFASKKEFVSESRISGYLAKLPSKCLHFTSRVAVNIIT